MHSDIQLPCSDSRAVPSGLPSSVPQPAAAVPSPFVLTALLCPLASPPPYRSLLQLYIDIEITDRHNQFYEKFATRQQVRWLAAGMKSLPCGGGRFGLPLAQARGLLRWSPGD